MLGEISNSIEYGLNASAKDFDGIHKYLRITDIDDSSRLFLTDKLSSPDVNFTDEDYENYKLQKNDLLFTRTGASVGKTYLYRKSDGEVYYAGFLIRARLRDSFDGNFVFQQTLTDKYKQFIEITSQRSGQPGVNGKEYGEWKIGMTSYHEQSAIGSLFRTLDDLLASYKDNLANYQSLKTTMLSKMFPKAGQSVPEIRLDGFEGKCWEEKKLIDLVSPVSRKVRKPSVPYYRMSIRSHAKGTFKQYVDDPKKIAMDNLFKVKENDLVVNITFAWEHAIAIAKKEDDGLLVSHRFPTFLIDKSDKDFINIYIKREEFRQNMELLSPGGAGRNRVLNVKDFIKIQMIVPELREQLAIGAYFSTLDNIIHSHQEKISQLETLKKKLLQDMFI